MSRFYRRTKPGFKDNLEAGILAAGIAVGTAAVSFYLVRLFLAREPLDPVEPGSQPGVSVSSGTGKDLSPAGEDQGR